MIGVNYSNGVIGSFVCDSSDTQTFLDDLAVAFDTCRWTLINRIAGALGTNGYRYKSVATLLGQQVYVSFSWDGTRVVLAGFPIVKFTISDGINSCGCGKIWVRASKKNRIICGPHQFFVFFDSRISPTPDVFGQGGNDASGGVPVTVSAGNAFWALGENNSFRRGLYPGNGGSEVGFLLNGVFRSGTPVPTFIAPQLLATRSSQLLDPIPFGDGNYPVSIPQMLFGVSPTLYVVSLWDAIVVSNLFTTPVVSLADFHDWEAFTIQGPVSTTVGCLFLATKSYVSSQVGAYAH